MVELKEQGMEKALEQKGFSRRSFLAGGTAAAGGVLLSSLLGGCSPEQAAASTGIKPSVGYVTHMTEICTGCRTCELICALSHDKVINPRKARNVVKTDIQLGDVTEVMYCKQCDDPKCLKACNAGALYVDEETGARVIDQEKCTGCRKCQEACIFAPTASRIKYNAETNTCFKCDLCGGDPMCVKRCPMGASMLSWKEYNIIRPKIDDYVEQKTEGAIEGVTFTKIYDGPHAGKAQDEKDWALVEDGDGVKVHGQITSSDGAELRVRMHCEFEDEKGNNLGSSEEHQWCLTMHEHLPLEFSFATADPTAIKNVNLVANISYWVSTEDEEY